MEETIRAEQRLQQAKVKELTEENNILREEKGEITKFFKESQLELRKLTEELLEIKSTQKIMEERVRWHDQLQAKDQSNKYDKSLFTQSADQGGLKDAQKPFASKFQGYTTTQ